jgi:hypothetical protein
VAPVVLAAGCGGGSHRLSHNEFVKQANAICADYTKRFVALGLTGFSAEMMSFEVASPRGMANLVSWSGKTLPIARQAFGKFKQLKPPKVDEAGWKALAAENDKTIVWLGKVHDAARRHDQTAISRLAADGQKDDARATRIAEKAGLDWC